MKIVEIQEDTTDQLEEDVFIKLNTNSIRCSDVDYDNAEKLARDIKIGRGDNIWCNLTGKFVFGDFIGAFIQENNLTVVDLMIVTLSGGIDNFEMLEALMDQGWVEKTTLILSSYFIRTEIKKHTTTESYLDELQHKENFSVYFTNCHQKICLIKTVKNNQHGYVTISGSANLRSSQSMEYINILENKELYDFNYNYYSNIIKNTNHGK